MSGLTIDFRSLISMAGSEEGARVLFERLIVALMRLKFRDARNLRAKQGDWGIDCFSGSLAGGAVVVWQAKYFPWGLDDNRKGAIRESFSTLVEASQSQGFTVTSWTLCLPCQLSSGEERWWERWKKGQQENTGIKVDLLQEDGLRSLLMAKDAEHIRLGTFGTNPSWIQYFVDALHLGRTEREILELPDDGLFEEAMFIRQLRAAAITELQSAKTAFFNAELLSQEVYDQADVSQARELKGLREKVRGLWESRFNLHSMTGTSAVDFYYQILLAIEQQSETNLRSPSTTATVLHKQGIGHQLADRCEIGWVQDFRTRFSPQRGESA